MARKKLGEMLVQAGVLSENGLRTALDEQRRWGGTLGRAVVELKLVSEAELVRVLSQQLGLPTVDLDHKDISASVLELVPAELAQEHHLVPFAQPAKVLDVAMADPTNIGLLDELRLRTQLHIRPHLAGPKMLERAIAKHYGRNITFSPRADRGVPPIPSSERVRPSGSDVPAAIEPSIDDSGPAPIGARDAEIDALQRRISALESQLARDEELLRKLLALLVDKGVTTRDEIVERIS